ncbi:hypothetical protein NQ318_006863 [Aromia moschata]|uniref:Uncharacterized protein n=1 Tax=Aromia moschata TaxID=1265417 RepID=A0AAV8YLD2_9CUCU|nr:hypothetical protein NQ318_006863 [Aromia moschata]
MYANRKHTRGVLGRLLAMIFHWFHMTAYSYDGDTLSSRTSHLKKTVGPSPLFSTVRGHYAREIWDYVMPHWMEAIVNDVPERA